MADENVSARNASAAQQAHAANGESSAPQSLSDLMNDPAAQKNAIHPHSAASAPAEKARLKKAAQAAQAQPAAKKARVAQGGAASTASAPNAQRPAAPRQAVRTSSSVRDPHADAAPRKPRVPKARRLKLSVTKVDPWSVAKVSFMLSIAFGIIQVVCACILWGVLQGVGAIDQLNNLVSSAGLSSSGGSSVFGFGQVISIVTIFSIFEVLLTVILSTICAFLYNVVSMLVGGIHMTLGDD